MVSKSWGRSKCGSYVPRKFLGKHMNGRARIWSQLLIIKASFSFSYVSNKKYKNDGGHRISAHVVGFPALLGLPSKYLTILENRLNRTVLISFGNTDYGYILLLKEANPVLMHNWAILKKQNRLSF